MGRATRCCCGMGGACGGTTTGPATAPGAYCRWPASTIACFTSAAVSTARDVASPSTAAKAMITPAVAVAPVRPWAHA